MAQNPRPLGTTRLGNHPSKTVYRKGPGSLSWDNVQIQPNTRFNANDWGCTESGRIEKAGDPFRKPQVEKTKPRRFEVAPQRKVDALRNQLLSDCRFGNRDGKTEISDADLAEWIGSAFKWDGYRYVAIPNATPTVTINRGVNATRPVAQVKSRSGNVRTVSEKELIAQMRKKIARWQDRGVAPEVIRERVRKAIAA